ncbi:MAG: hypothetical protein WKF73_17930 [Nocardioidaceae bacterium]
MSPPHRGHDVLVQVRGDPGPGDRALVHADVEAVRATGGSHRAHRAVGSAPQPPTVSASSSSV